jgi:hypothetical protein
MDRAQHEPLDVTSSYRVIGDVMLVCSPHARTDLAPLLFLLSSFSSGCANLS